MISGHLADSSKDNNEYFARLSKVQEMTQAMKTRGAKHVFVSTDTQTDLPSSVANFTGEQSRGQCWRDEKQIERHNLILEFCEKHKFKAANTFLPQYSCKDQWVTRCKWNARRSTGSQIDHIFIPMHLSHLCNVAQKRCLKSDHFLIACLIQHTHVGKDSIYSELTYTFEGRFREPSFKGWRPCTDADRRRFKTNITHSCHDIAVGALCL